MANLPGTGMTEAARKAIGAAILALAILGLPPYAAAEPTAAAPTATAPAADRTPSDIPAGVPDAAPLPVAVNSCATLRVALSDEVKSATARAGDIFHFKTLDPLDLGDGSTIPPETVGVGVVSLAQHAGRGGVGGFIALDPRYIEPAGSKNVDVLIDRSAPSLAPTGKSNDIPGVVGLIPFAGWVLGPYGFLHRGSDITLPPGTSFRVFAGDLDTISKCRAKA